MWRAGTLLLLILSQDSASPYADAEGEFLIQPPAGWARRKGAGAILVEFAPAVKTAAPCGIEVIRYPSPNPTPLKSFMAQARKHITDKFKIAKFDEDQEVTIGGRPGGRLVYVNGATLQIKLVVFRTNHDYFLLDGSVPVAEVARYRPVVEKALASFEIVPLPLSADERASHGRFLDVVKVAKVQPDLLGERWHGVFLATVRVGHYRVKLSESAGRYDFEADVINDFGDGGRESTVARGSFAPDGSFQKIDTEQTKTHKDERWQFRASAVLEGGRVKAARDLNGYKEERSFAVEPGVVFTDVADVMRRVLVGAGKGAFLLKTLSPYADEPKTELVEVNEKEPQEVNGRKCDAYVVFTRLDRRRPMTYYYGADRSMLRMGGAREAFSIRASTKEEIQK